MLPFTTSTDGKFAISLTSHQPARASKSLTARFRISAVAQRSAGAAREIKELIEASVGKIETGTQLVHGAGATMTEIVGAVQRVTATMGEISAASAEQSQGVGQVNSAVADLDRMTQQNAALVEQSAAASESLKEQAQRLARSLAVFRLEGSAPAGG